RLSYFLWDAPPDAELLDAAASGALDDGEGMRAQAERMLEDDRAKPVLRHFLSEWLELEGATILPGLDETPKDGDLFPVFNDPLRVAMRKEIEAFMDYVMFERDGSLEALFTDTRAYVNGPLAELYGVSDGPSDADTWEWVELDATQRAGMLTRAGFLAVHASQTATSPIRRGVYMLREVLCYDLPPPPADVDNTPIEATDLDETKTPSVREETMRRTGNASCSGCHVAINELGFAFEHYNAIGQWQDKEVGGAVIDASSTLRHAGGELDGPIDGAIELSSRLAMSPSVAACASERWFEMALRRIPGDLDECSLAEIAAKTEDSGSIRDLLLAVVESDAFVSVNHGVDGLGEGK
ncbi:MAG: DUF1592 domain-containing protein, partial [Myxococcales bacterium]|nr:DUF1592 domain-containing protein [Myxococcales bacterium]